MLHPCNTCLSLSAKEVNRQPALIGSFISNTAVGDHLSLVCLLVDGESLGQMLADLATLYRAEALSPREETRLGMQQIIAQAAGLLSPGSSITGVSQASVIFLACYSVVHVPQLHHMSKAS